MNIRRYAQEYLPGPDGIEPTYGAGRSGVFEPLTNHLKIVVGRLVAIMLALLIGLLVSSAAFCSGTVIDVNPGNDLDAKANAAPAGATIHVHGKAGVGTYFYTINNDISLKNGQTLVGDTGTTKQFGPASVPNPVVGIKKARRVSMTTLVKTEGDPVTISWLEVKATGAGKGVTAELAGPGLRMDHLRVYGAKGPGIGQAQGVLTDSELFSNGKNASTIGHTAAGIKCIVACEVATTYSHDNGGNGLWCDVGCAPVRARANGVWFHDNVTKGNSRFGIRYENSPKPDLNPNDPVSALIEGNRSYGNGEGGVAVADAANATVRDNVFGRKLDGTMVHNGRKLAVILRNSGEADRGTQKNATVSGNDLNREGITDRNLRGNVCTNNY
jgi:hypothetical protein